METVAYGALADWFELLNDDCDYETWSQYFIKGLSDLGVGKRGMELGCGSGAFCRALKRAGYDVTGADLSLPMLQKAKELALKEGLDIPFLQMDARKIKSLERLDFLLSPNDCYNYLKGSELGSAFRKAAACLKKGGIFWFDVSSEYKLCKKIANNSMADDRDEVTYLSFNTLFEDRVEMNVTLFVKRKDGAFDRYDELHVQYIHTEEALKAALKTAGFEILRVEGHLGEEKATSDRLNFICRRI